MNRRFFPGGIAILIFVGWVPRGFGSEIIESKVPVSQTELELSAVEATNRSTHARMGLSASQWSPTELKLNEAPTAVESSEVFRAETPSVAATFIFPLGIHSPNFHLFGDLGLNYVQMSRSAKPIRAAMIRQDLHFFGAQLGLRGEFALNPAFGVYGMLGVLPAVAFVPDSAVGIGSQSFAIPAAGESGLVFLPSWLNPIALTVAWRGTADPFVREGWADWGAKLGLELFLE